MADLHLHVSLDDRKNLNDGAIQGELFSGFGEEEFTRGYRGTTACKVAGITYRQLDYWDRKKILEPSIMPSKGSGSRRLYSFKDIVILAVSKRLADAGIQLQNITTAIGFLRQRTTEQLSDITIMCDGTKVFECTSNEQVIELMQSGKAVFGVSVGSTWHKLEEDIDGEEYVDLTEQPTQSAANPIDELTAMRMRKKLEAQRIAREAA